MKVSVHYFGQLGATAGKQEEARDLADGSRLIDLVREAAGTHGESFARILLDESGDPRPSVMFTVNGVMAAEPETTTLSEGDTVGMLSAIAGG